MVFLSFFRRSMTVILTIAALLVVCTAACAAEISAQRAIEVKDIIEMTRVANAACPSDGGSPSETNQLSPDKSRFFVVLSKGNLRGNVNEYSLGTFDSRALRPGLKPRALVTMKSSGEPAIRDTCWMRDNRTILFIGTRPEGDAAVYSIDVVTGGLKRLTPRSAPVLRYAVTDNERGMVYISRLLPIRKPGPSIETDKPFVVENQNLWELIAGDRNDGDQQFAVYSRSFGRKARKVWSGNGLNSQFLSVSPDGRYAVVCKRVLANELPKEWEDYDYGPDNAIIKPLFRTTASDSVVPFQRYVIIDLLKHTISPLWDAPRLARGFQQLKWSSEGRSILLRDVFLPHTEHQSTELPEQQSDVRIDLGSRYWALEANVDWSRPAVQPTPLHIDLEQGLNQPPRFFAASTVTGRRELLFDLNPQFKQLQFGSARVISWQVRGIAVKSGLYLPPDYTPNMRFPLVIQTHGFDDKQFSMDGNAEWSSAFAARLLTARGIAVLQAYDFCDPKDHDRVGRDRSLGLTREERFRTFAALVYESAIHELDSKGIIDTSRVGISGFSRTVWFVEYMLTHSSIPFKAALLVDGIDGGYFNYLAFKDTEFEADNGGLAPFGRDGLNRWLSEAPGFNLDHVTSPVRLVSLDTGPSLVLNWEWFAGLRLLRKPVELTVFPNASHILVRPTDRYIAMTDMVKWFEFWLVDPDHDDQFRKPIPKSWVVMKDTFSR
jgi:hypothetical protein